MKLAHGDSTSLRKSRYHAKCTPQCCPPTNRSSQKHLNLVAANQGTVAPLHFVLHYRGSQSIRSWWLMWVEAMEPIPDCCETEAAGMQDAYEVPGKPSQLRSSELEFINLNFLSPCGV